MRIERGASNTFTLAARPTLTPSKWLLRFVHATDEGIYQLCLAQAIANVGRPVQLTFTEVASNPDPQDAEVTLSPGQWNLYVYEQDDTSLNWTLAGRLVFEQLVEVVGAAIPPPTPTDPCGGDCPTLCEQLADPLVDVPAAVDCIPGANIPEWTVVIIEQPEATPEVIAVAVTGAGKAEGVKAILCDPCPECDPLTVLVNSDEYSTIPNPCGSDADVRVRDASNTPTGFLDGGTWRIPSVTVLRDGAPFSTELPGATVDVPSNCPACEDVTVQLKDSENNDIGTPDVYAPGTNTTKTAPDATVQLRDSAANNIGSPVAFLSNSSNNLTAPDGTFQRKDSAGNDIGSPIAVRSNQTGVVATCPDATAVVKNLNGTTLITEAILSNASENITAPIPLKFGWGAGDADTLVWTVTDDEAGSYDTYTPTGTNGTITYSLNGGGYAALIGTIALAVNDTITVRRTTTTNAGSVKWEP